MAPTVSTIREVAADQLEALDDIEREGERALLRFELPVQANGLRPGPIVFAPDVELSVLRGSVSGAELRPGLSGSEVTFLIAYLALGGLASNVGGLTPLDDQPGATGFSIFVAEAPPADPQTYPPVVSGDPLPEGVVQYRVVGLLKAMREQGHLIFYKLAGRA